MTPASWIALAIGLTSLVLNLLTLAIGYGVLRGTVQALGKRVEALEVEIGALTELRIQVGKIGERQDIWIEQLKELNASVRWMREPAPMDAPRPPARTRSKL
ncbi:hypothetical protein [Caulobacter sp. 602-1]|uniref:hypothetical protein n=1 Tax=Caulobacter sp. 602-1 TaxID=2492472 RepID=UPI000F63E4E1|nr:hypothetical protein [Caulobacter sp. 602-1]RRN64633.1 hypothetical protein EIK80_11400 [Caulobacter sp. 602-1]